MTFSANGLRTLKGEFSPADITLTRKIYRLESCFHCEWRYLENKHSFFKSRQMRMHIHFRELSQKDSVLREAVETVTAEFFYIVLELLEHA